MVNLTADRITTICHRLLSAGGAPDQHASIVAEHLADANLTGHDSHGLIRIPQYMGEIKSGRLDPSAEPAVTRDDQAIVQVNGNNTFGQVVAKYASEVAMTKAKEHGISMVAMHSLTHTGRIGAYPEMIAKEEMAGIMFCGYAFRGAGGVAPFGGREGRLGTNPISMSFPLSPDKVVLLDFATSIAAQGKIHVYRSRGQKLPGNWVLDKEGAVSNDPNDYFDGGALLPMGGLDGGHKGYALSFMVLLLSGLLGGIQSWKEGGDLAYYGNSIAAIDLERFAPVDQLREHVSRLVDLVKDTTPLPGFDGVLYPGEIEEKNREDRRAKGVEVEQATWDQVVDLIKEYGLEEELGVKG